MAARLTAAEKQRRKKLAAKPRKVGRPRKVVIPTSIEKLAELGAPLKEMAPILNLSLSTLTERLSKDPEFRAALERGQAACKLKLRNLQWHHAEGEGGPAVNMAIHMSKHQLGETDRPVDTHSTVDVKIELISAGERIAARFDEINRRLTGAAAGAEVLPQLEVLGTVEPGTYSEITIATPGPVAERVEGRGDGAVAEGEAGRVYPEPVGI
jgi:hypothetical protein